MSYEYAYRLLGTGDQVPESDFFPVGGEHLQTGDVGHFKGCGNSFGRGGKEGVFVCFLGAAMATTVEWAVRDGGFGVTNDRGTLFFPRSGVPLCHHGSVLPDMIALFIRQAGQAEPRGKRLFREPSFLGRGCSSPKYGVCVGEAFRPTGDDGWRDDGA